MHDYNEDDLAIYEESEEIKEILWKIWDIINDKEIIEKTLLSSPLIIELENQLNITKGDGGTNQKTHLDTKSK